MHDATYDTARQPGRAAPALARRRRRRPARGRRRGVPRAPASSSTRTCWPFCSGSASALGGLALTDAAPPDRRRLGRRRSGASSRRRRARCPGWRCSSCRSLFGLPRPLPVDRHRPRWPPTTSCSEKALYLNVPFFLVRAGLLLRRLDRPRLLALTRWSRRAGPHRRPRARDPHARTLSAAGLVALRPHDDLRGGRLGHVARAALVLDDLRVPVHRRPGALGAGLRASSIARRLLGRGADVGASTTPAHFHDLGKLLFAFVMLWAYLSFSQFLIIWSANLPEEIPWYLHRLDQRLGVHRRSALVVFHFAVPFIVLLSRRIEAQRGAAGRRWRCG